MRIDFPYPGIDSIDIPDQNLLGIFAPSTVEIEKSEDQIIEEALLQPIGSPLSTKSLNGVRTS